MMYLIIILLGNKGGKVFQRTVKDIIMTQSEESSSGEEGSKG